MIRGQINAKREDAVTGQGTGCSPTTKLWGDVTARQRKNQEKEKRKCGGLCPPSERSRSGSYLKDSDEGVGGRVVGGGRKNVKRKLCTV